MEKRPLFPAHIFIVQGVADAVERMRELSRLLARGEKEDSNKVVQLLNSATYAISCCTILRNIEISTEKRTGQKESDLEYVIRILSKARDELKTITLAGQAHPLCGVVDDAIKVLAS